MGLELGRPRPDRPEIAGRAIDGRAIAAAITDQVGIEVARLQSLGVQPKLGIIVATDDEGTASYVRAITRAAARVGIDVAIPDLAASATTEEIEAACGQLADDPGCQGIVGQAPFRKGVDTTRVIARIPTAKDVDGATPESAGRLAHGLPAFAPATAQAVIEILAAEGVALSGARVVVVGRSLVVGKPVATLLLAADSTVTICHSRTRDLARVCREADVLVAAIGRARFIGRDHVRDGAVVIDVGTNASDDGLTGDVDFAAVAEHVAKITPVPGGVGPVTTACLLRNVAAAAALTV